MSDCHFPHVAWIILSILAYINNPVVWMVSTRPLISKSPIPCTNPWLNVRSAAIKIRITVTYMFHSFSVLKEVFGTYLSFCFHSVSSCVHPERHRHYSAGSLLFWIITRSGHQIEIRWSGCISKSQFILCFSFFRAASWLRIYHRFV